MERKDYTESAIRLCGICNIPLEKNTHGNRRYHPECSRKEKLQRQKRNYQVGNSAKLLIQKNEKVAARLYEMDKQKSGIPVTFALELGLKFNCPTLKVKHLNMEVNMFGQYGYVIETIKGEILIFIYHESELLQFA